MNQEGLCLCVGGLDPSCHAGLFVDGLAVQAAGVRPALVPACLTAQSKNSARATLPVPEDFLRLQIQTLAESSRIRCVKTGALCSGSAIGVIEELTRQFRIPLVVDPVLSTSTGMQLNRPEDIKQLFPGARIITPNLHEAELLTSMSIPDPEHMIEAGRQLLDLGPDAVLIKAGHLEQPVDALVLAQKVLIFEHSKKPDRRGTGCALASFIAAKLCQGHQIVPAVEAGLRWLHSEYLTAA